jgi:hypothetical protein
MFGGGDHMTNYHTGVTLFDYEITISPRGGIGVESVKIRARDKNPGESDVTYKDYLLQTAINAGFTVAQHYVTKYIKEN